MFSGSCWYASRAQRYTHCWVSSEDSWIWKAILYISCRWGIWAEMFRLLSSVLCEMCQHFKILSKTGMTVDWTWQLYNVYQYLQFDSREKIHHSCGKSFYYPCRIVTPEERSSILIVIDYNNKFQLLMFWS